MNSQELLQYLYIEKRESKETTKHKQTKRQTIAPNDKWYKWSIHIIKRLKDQGFREKGEWNIGIKTCVHPP